MTIEDIKNIGYKVIKCGDHDYEILDGFEYRGIVTINGKKKIYHVSLDEKCPAYNVSFEVKTPEDIKTFIEGYFKEGLRYDMYNHQITPEWRKYSYIYNFLKNYGFKNGNMYGFKNGNMTHSLTVFEFTKNIGHRHNLSVTLDTETNELRCWFGDSSYTHERFKMWDNKSVEDAISAILTVPVLTEVGNGFDLLAKLPVTTKTPGITTTPLELFGVKKDDVKTMLESARNNIDTLLATL